LFILLHQKTKKSPYISARASFYEKTTRFYILNSHLFYKQHTLNECKGAFSLCGKKKHITTKYAKKTLSTQRKKYKNFHALCETLALFAVKKQNQPPSTQSTQ
jgi:hypothetical protein